MDGALSTAAGSRTRRTTPSRSAGRLSYREALDYLFARTTGKWKLGLERMEALLGRIGHPDKQLKVFHVAGTNGKGSVCATLDAALRAPGRKVALYTSPHLVDFRERFLIDGVPITEDDVTDWIARRTPLVERLGATFFEATTAMAFELFARAEVDVAVIEVGLGGRLDATNVIDPLVAGVTSIGIDHVEFLGHTHEQIALEKAGIFKRGRPAIIGERDPAIRALLARLAHKAGADPVRLVANEATITDIRLEPLDGTAFTLALPSGTAHLRTPLAGAHQATNTALALMLLDAAGPEYALSPGRAQGALDRVVLPGRFHRHGRFILDVAHNPDGAAVLADTLRAVDPPRPVTAVLSVLADKDWRGVMDALAPVVDLFLVTNAPSAPSARAWLPEAALTYATARDWKAELEPDFDRALERGDATGGTVLVTGSFHTVGDALARLPVPSATG